MTGHTKEPWATNGRRVESANDHGWANDGWIIAALEGPEGEANARRIVACVNACEGWDTEQLESGAMKLAMQSGLQLWIAYTDKKAEAEQATEQRDELLAALETTAGNIRRLAAAGKCNTFDGWLDVVESAIAKVKGGAQ